MEHLDITEHFSGMDAAPAEAAAVIGGQSVRFVRLVGVGGWHCHADAAETVLVWAGRFRVEYRDGATELQAGQMCVVPSGCEHRGVADGSADVVLIRPAER